MTSKTVCECCGQTIPTPEERELVRHLDEFIEKEVARRREARNPTLPVSRAAKRLGISDRTLRRRIAEGKVEALQVLGNLRIRRSEIDRILAEAKAAT